MHDVVVVVGGGLVVVVVVLGTVVVVVGGGSEGDVVVVGGAGVDVVDTAAAVPGVSTSDTDAGGDGVTGRWDVRVVVVTDPPGTLEVVLDDVLGAGGAAAAAVFGPDGAGPTSCTACAGSRGLEPPGAKATSTASRRPTTASPANMPARCERGCCSGGASANSGWIRCRASPSATGAPPSPGPGPIPSSSMSIRSSSAGSAGSSHQRKPRVARKLTSGPASRQRGWQRTALTGRGREARP